VLPAPKDSPRITKKMEKEYEHHELTDMDPSVSARMGAETSGGEAYDEDEEGPRGPSVACAQQLVIYDYQFDTRAAGRAGSVDGPSFDATACWKLPCKVAAVWEIFLKRDDEARRDGGGRREGQQGGWTGPSL
ncbi:DnaJ (Hsp40), sub A, member 4, partial [Perkinsus olseni]